MSESKSTLITVLITGMLALLGTVWGGVIRGCWDVKIEQQKLHSNLILKSMESDLPDERLHSLQFMVETNLIKDKEIRNGLDAYLNNAVNRKTKIPQIRSTPRPLQELNSEEIDAIESFFITLGELLSTLEATIQVAKIQPVTDTKVSRIASILLADISAGKSKHHSIRLAWRAGRIKLEVPTESERERLTNLLEKANDLKPNLGESQMLYDEIQLFISQLLSSK